jgi:hypothetical protein
VPEFNFMDPRALGKYDFLPRDETEAAIWALDADEAGEYGTGGRPPPNEDGTPDETLSDQVIRLRQLMSGTFHSFSQTKHIPLCCALVCTMIFLSGWIPI